jgi:hypothetical protein
VRREGKLAWLLRTVSLCSLAALKLEWVELWAFEGKIVALAYPLFADMSSRTPVQVVAQAGVRQVGYGGCAWPVAVAETAVPRLLLGLFQPPRLTFVNLSFSLLHLYQKPRQERHLASKQEARLSPPSRYIAATG